MTKMKTKMNEKDISKRNLLSNGQKSTLSLSYDERFLKPFL